MLRAWLLLCVIAMACFSEPSTQGGTSSGCDEGSQGCSCYGNGTCDGDLACREGACVPAGCTAGALDCTCVDGTCLGGLVCGPVGVCNEPGGTSGGLVTSTSTPATSTSGLDTTAFMSTGGPESSGEVGVSGTTAVVPACDEQPSCVACLMCAGTGECSDAWDACTMSESCKPLANCVEACTPPDNACLETCAGTYPDGKILYRAFLDCATCFCPVSCPSLAGECG